LEIGCGAGFLLRFLHHAFPALDLTGIDRQSNLTALIPENDRLQVLTADYVSAAPTGQHDLILCDFGWDSHDIPRSMKPHTSAEIAGKSYCPGCSDDLFDHFRPLLGAWKAWGVPEGELALCGRLTGIGDIRAVVLAAASVGWHPILRASTTLRVRNSNGQWETFPALVFGPKSEGSTDSNLEALVQSYEGG
jgi:hypothetical protein